MLKCRPEIKYQDQGGPSIVECAQMMQALRLPASDLVDFVDRVIFNFLIGNGDAHGKNFSVLYYGPRPRLAPVYDVLCTTVYPSIGKKMAMKVDGKFEFRWVSQGKFLRTFARAGIGENLVSDSVMRQIERLRANIAQVSDVAEVCHPSPIYHDIIKGIWSRIRQLESSTSD